MPDSVLIQVAAAVKTELDGGSFALAPAIERLYLPQATPADVAGLTVMVRPAGREVRRLDRSRFERDYFVEVAIQKQVAARTNAVIDPLVAVAEEIADYLLDRPLAGYPAAKFIEQEVLTPVSDEHLASANVVTAIVRITYREGR